MAQFVGIDLGSYSVKLVVVDVRFRETKLRGAYEQRVSATTTEGRPAPPPPSPGTQGGTQKTALAPMAGLTLATDALKQLLTTHSVKVEAGGIAALPGERVSVRHLVLPFGDVRKLAKVVPFELEAQIPFDIDDVVYDHIVVARSQNKAELLAAASPKSEVSQTLDALRSVDVDPRMLAASPMAYGPLLQRIVPPGPEAVALVDMGHVRTNVCMVKDKHVFYARCISRGGLDVTRAIAKAYRSNSLADAERGKHAQAMVAPATDTFPSSQHAQVAETCRNALAPLVRDLKQSLAACRAQGQEVNRVILCGGASQLKGIAAYLANELEVPVGGLPTQWTGLGAVAIEPSQALGAALALAGSAGKGQVLDLRKGPFAYHGDTSALRTRLPMLAAWAAVVIACLGVNAIASYRSLKSEGVMLDQRLERETRMLFGTPRTDAAQIAKELRSGGKEQNPIPEITAYDVLTEISKVSPDTDKVWLDVLELDIKPKKTFIRATADTLGHVDDVVKALKTINCFEEVKQGRTQDVGKVKEFSLDIKTRCP